MSNLSAQYFVLLIFKQSKIVKKFVIILKIINITNYYRVKKIICTLYNILIYFSISIPNTAYVILRTVLKYFNDYSQKTLESSFQLDHIFVWISSIIFPREKQRCQRRPIHPALLLSALNGGDKKPVNNVVWPGIRHVKFEDLLLTADQSPPKSTKITPLVTKHPSKVHFSIVPTSHHPPSQHAQTIIVTNVGGRARNVQYSNKQKNVYVPKYISKYNKYKRTLTYQRRT